MYVGMHVEAQGWLSVLFFFSIVLSLLRQDHFLNAALNSVSLVSQTSLGYPFSVFVHCDYKHAAMPTSYFHGYW